MASPPENTRTPGGLQQTQDHVQYPSDDVSANETDISNNGITNIDVQTDTICEIEKLCKKHGLPLNRARRAARVLLGENYSPSNLTLPSKAKFLWCDRDKEKENNPIAFLEKHWGQYIREDVMSQCDLRNLDKSLFEAIKTWCRNKGKNPQHYLPPPAWEHARPEGSSAVRRARPAQQPEP